MKKFIRRVQNLSEKAAHLRAAAERAPAQVRELRETVRATAGEFQQLRGDVQSAVTGLRLDGEEELTRALAELDGSREIFSEAGYDLAGVDLELGPARRLLVHLEKFEDVPVAGLELLLASITARRTTHAVLEALIRAEQLADRVSLSELDYRELTIYVGPMPTVRLCWRPVETDSEETVAAPAYAAVAPSVAEPQPPPLPASAGGSFFATRPVVSSPQPPPPEPPPAIPPAAFAPALPGVAPAPVAVSPPSPLAGDWKASALDRFKKMPDLTRR